ncbi:unnamed protein product [Xylocopa violacea]|uniref:Uncharacterized protein n=1 Tax=Xylocopa violacea TaxID=135666 RepID=A0ABP1NXC0_XYLVO
MCITNGPLNIIPSRDKKPTISQFLSDILIKLPTVCGKPLQISEHTPFSTKFLSTNLSSNVLPKDKGINIHSIEKNNTTSQLEFSANYADELHKMKNINTSLETQLAKIHQIHNVPFHENLKVNSSRSTREFQDGIQCSNTVQNMKGASVENNASDNFTASDAESISNYFKIQKPHSSVNEKLLKQDEKQKNLTLKEKLVKAAATKNNKESVKEMDQSITVEAMAKNNQLDQMRICDLSEWLRQHSVPHNSKAKKTELISKVLSHIRNTQMLHQFRI